MQKQWMGVHFGKSEGIRSCGKLICTNCNFQWRVFWAPNKRNGSVKNKVLHGPIMSCPIFLSYIHVDECVGSNRTTNGFQGSYFSALHALGRHHPPAKIWLTTSQTLKYSNSQKIPKNWKPRNYGKNMCRIICTIPYHPGNTCVSSGLHGLLFPRKPGKKKGQRPSVDTGRPLDNVTSPLRFIRTSPGC